MAVLASDDFNRADANPIGGNWTTGFDRAAMKIVSNTAQPTTVSANDCASRYTAVTPPANNYSQAQVTVSGTTAGSGMCLCLRYATGADTLYRVAISHAASNNIELAKFVAATFTQIWARTQSFTDGATFRLEANGTTLRVYHNGAQIGADATDSAIASGQAGIGSSTTFTSGSLDNWEMGNLLSPRPFRRTTRMFTR